MWCFFFFRQILYWLQFLCLWYASRVLIADLISSFNQSGRVPRFTRFDFTGACLFKLSTNKPPHVKTNKVTVRPAKTQTVYPDWSESSLGVHAILLVLSWGGSNISLQLLKLWFGCVCVIHGPRQANLVLIAYASSEGSGQPAHPRSLARTFAARSCKQWVKRNLQTESQISGPSGWLGMRS